MSEFIKIRCLDFFIIVGWLNIPKKVVYEIFHDIYPHCRCCFVEKEHYLKSRFTYAHTTGKKIDAIFIGPVPHKSFAAGKHSSMVAELNIANSIIPVYVCKNKSGVLKFTKTSIRQAIVNHKQYLAERAMKKEEQEDPKITEFNQGNVP